jgi:hypothetical protein
MSAATRAQDLRESRLSQRAGRGFFQISKGDHAKHRISEVYACLALLSRALHEERGLIADLSLLSGRTTQQSDQASPQRARSQGST